MGNRRQFKANLKSHNHAWLERLARERSEGVDEKVSMNKILNEILDAERQKHGASTVPTPCVTSRVQ